MGKQRKALNPSTKRCYRSRLFSYPEVVGVGLGRHPEGPEGEECLVVLTSGQQEVVRQRLSRSWRVTPTVVVETGILRTLPQKFEG